MSALDPFELNASTHVCPPGRIAVRTILKRLVDVLARKVLLLERGLEGVHLCGAQVSVRRDQ